MASEISFFFVGAGKCGTSWIYTVMKRHGVVCVPSVKEPQLMECDDKERTRRIRTYYKGSQKRADFSNTYFFDPSNARTIADYNPDAKVVITTRFPSSRIRSHFQFLRRNGLDANISLANYLEGGDPVSIVARSDYRDMIERYRNAVGVDQVLVHPIELLKLDPQAYFERLCNFLSVPSVTLDDADRGVVLPASSPRNQFVARLAKSLAEKLRENGHLWLLARVKDSRLINRVLFSDRSPVASGGFGIQADRISALDEGYPELIREFAPDIAAKIGMA